jgi:hypothetical protein
MLRERFPSLRFEVINTGITAVNSHVLLPAIRDLAQREGDLFVLYMGNNEVVGPYGAGTTLTRPGMSLPLIRAGILLNSTRLGQLIAAALRPSETDPWAWRGMEMFLEQRVPADALPWSGSTNISEATCATSSLWGGTRVGGPVRRSA